MNVKLDNHTVPVCPMCGRAVYDNNPVNNVRYPDQVSAGMIDGEPAHLNCILEDMDEQGLDDFFNEG